MKTQHVAWALVGLVAGCECGGDPPRSDAGMPRDAYAAPGTDAPFPDVFASTTADVWTPPSDAPVPMSTLVDPTCIDGMYTETLPTPTASVDDLVAGYSASSGFAFVQAILERRYPHGWTLTREGRGGFIDCLNTFFSDRSSARAAFSQLGTIVHECGHVYDNTLSSGGTNGYSIHATLRLDGARGDTTSRGGNTFARSRIRRDTYQAARPPCDSGSRCDFYANVYLDGDPDNASFEGGDQGFNLLMEEAVQYTNSIAVGYAFADRVTGSVSERDGILTFLWYMERYLRMARLDYPTAYAHILNGDGGRWRRLILTVWGRAWLYLELTNGDSRLGIEDDMIEGLVRTPELLEEIERIRVAEGC